MYRHPLQKGAPVPGRRGALGTREHKGDRHRRTRVPFECFSLLLLRPRLNHTALAAAGRQVSAGTARIGVSIRPTSALTSPRGDVLGWGLTLSQQEVAVHRRVGSAPISAQLTRKIVYRN